MNDSERKTSITGVEKTKGRKQKIFNSIILLLITITVAITLMLLFNNNDDGQLIENSSADDMVSKQGDDSYIIKSNTNQYIVTTSEHELDFYIYGYIESDIVNYNEEFSYYQNMISRTDISDDIEVNAHELNNVKIIEVSVNGDTKYFGVFENEYNIIINEVKFDFTDFDKQFTKLSDMLDLYPPEETIDNLEGKNVHNFTYNENITGSNEEVKLYEKYVDLMNYTDIIGMRNYEYIYALELFIDGNSKSIEGSSFTNTFKPSNYSDVESPFIVKDDYLLSLTTKSDEQNGITLTQFFDKSKLDYNVGYSSLILDFTESEYNVADLDINLFMNEDINVNEEDMLILDNRLYIFPQKFNADDNGEIYMTTDLVIMDGDEDVFSYNDLTIGNYNPMYHNNDSN